LDSKKAILEAQRAKDDAVQDKKDAEALAKQASIDADLRIKQAEATAKANAEVMAEEAKQWELNETAKREANKAHVSKIKRDAYADILGIVSGLAEGMTYKEIAIAIVQGLADGNIKNVTINY
jgi:F0F1-type ATP synthase membrane subunit b/b'